MTWTTLGVTNTTVKKWTMTMQIVLSVGGKNDAGGYGLYYTAKKGKAGTGQAA